MGRDVILEELNYLNELLNECLRVMDEILRLRVGSIFWRLFFPAGQFMQQESNAKSAAAILVNIDVRLREMAEVLEERNHPLLQSIQQLLTIDLNDMADKLVELPQRAQYIMPQVEEIKIQVEALISEMNRK
ncbi:MAG: hypothetical protein ACFFDT_03790 [Candidatus Hodarchaeota archaeon]